ncbi:hypothetical protein [Sphingomonas sp. CFBP 13720]|uniref:hypothetical protein n=1 Tax=Sphingomonas sp. CFBP 13720 TaxID=2775302 RepID=UPI001784FA6D|nr:hypothetical protein [Sphingomonas sp. CFBP 13720]MBD8679046.1 hypothetical protein [Sphingomonas sp. CFBP 13720]
MAFRNNDTLIQTANTQVVAANGGDDVYVATGATAFVIAAGAVGDDSFIGFDSNDSLINTVKIFDGNNDGFIQFGPNGVLDIDRTTRNNPGNDQLQLVGPESDIVEIRYLGAKGGQHVYADSATLKNLWTEFGAARVTEGTVGNDTINFGASSKVLLVDNALGLNLGGDTLTGFGNDDLLVTTSQLFDRTGNEIVTFGQNQVLDVSGAEGPKSSDPTTGPGGQLDFNAPNLQDVHYLGTNVINGVEYFYYGTAGSTFDPTAGA